MFWNEVGDDVWHFVANALATNLINPLQGSFILGMSTKDIAIGFTTRGSSFPIFFCSLYGEMRVMITQEVEEGRWKQLQVNIDKFRALASSDVISKMRNVIYNVTQIHFTNK
ncbi:hypothetical protein CR513_57622, partial [Mucuna pruriens]